MISSSSSFHYKMLGTTRTPGSEEDEMIYTPHSTHITLIVVGREGKEMGSFTLDVVDPTSPSSVVQHKYITYIQTFILCMMKY